ncbi:MAG: NUDIX hydrolase [Cytophagales bacterium]|nr:NUDIX hydrolase [Cytophagales bacterium]
MKEAKSDHSLTNIYYYGSEKILVAVDCIIFGFDINEEKLKILLFKRLVEPFAGQWSLVGSFVHKDEDLSVAAHRILKELAGLKNVFLEQLTCYGKVNRDPGSRVISIAYYSLIQINRKLKNLHEAQWFDVKDMPPLVLDHNEMVRDAQEQLQQNAIRKPVGFNLLPEYFTLPQLLKLYQEIYQKPLDDRNFRKKILSMDLLVKSGKKDKSSSKKGAFLYKFDKGRYNNLIKKGFLFEL